MRVRLARLQTSQYVGLLIVACGLAVAAVYAASRWERAAVANSVATADDSAPKCGHWAVCRSCELLGIPLTMEEILVQMPSSIAGHSMLQISDIMRDEGAAVRARQETYGSLQAGKFPCIAHLQSPDHFVVVSSATSERVNLFDCFGRRDSWPAEKFMARWSGHVLWVQQNCMVDESSNGARVRFDEYFHDIGSVPITGAPIHFAYTFENYGNAELQIAEVVADCECLDVSYPKDAIEPGAQGQIEVTYRPSAQRGPFYRAIRVATNDEGRAAVVLRAAGYGDTGVSIVPSASQLGEIVAGAKERMYFFIKDGTDEQGLRVVGVSFPFADPNLVVLPPRSRLPASYSHASTFLPQETVLNRDTTGVFVDFTVPDRPGHFKDVLSIRTTVKAFEELRVPISGEIVSPLLCLPDRLTVPISADRVREEIHVEWGGSADARLKIASVTVSGVDKYVRAVVTGDELTGASIVLEGKDDWPPTSSVRGHVEIRVEELLSDKEFVRTIPVNIWD